MTSRHARNDEEKLTELDAGKKNPLFSLLFSPSVFSFSFLIFITLLPSTRDSLSLSLLHKPDLLCQIRLQFINVKDENEFHLSVLYQFCIEILFCRTWKWNCVLLDEKQIVFEIKIYLSTCLKISIFIFSLPPPILSSWGFFENSKSRWRLLI